MAYRRSKKMARQAWNLAFQAHMTVLTGHAVSRENWASAEYLYDIGMPPEAAAVQLAPINPRKLY